MSNHVEIRLIRTEDIAELCSWFSHASVSSMINDVPRSPRAMQKSFQKLSENVPNEDEECGLVAVYNGTIEIFVNLMWINWIARTAEFDIIVSPTASHPILAIQAMRSLREYTRDVLNLRMAYGFIYESNTRSIRLASRLMQRHATLTKYKKNSAGLYEDVHIFSMNLEERWALKERGAEVVSNLTLPAE